MSGTTGAAHTGIPVLLVLCMLAMGGCTCGGASTGGEPTGGEPTDGAILAASPANSPALNAAIARAEQLLSEGRAIPDVLVALSDQLKADARVFDVALDPLDGSVSVVFEDGETHTIALADEEAPSDDLSSARALPRLDARAAADRVPVTSGAHPSAPALRAAGAGTYRMPASARMLLANSLTSFHSRNANFVVTESTPLIGKMLAARGYQGAPSNEITIEMFDDLTSHGVIVLETHGGARPLKYPQELLGAANCGGRFSTYNIVTTELATAEKILRHVADIGCGRINLYDALTRRGGRLVVKRQYLAVTPNYIREHDRGTFPDDTLMLISSCGAYAADMSSPLRDTLFEKSSRGARFLAWNGKVSARLAIRAALNLFQLMTASNEELTGKEGFEALKRSAPPRGGNFTALQMALYELEQKSYLDDPGHGTRLVLSVQGAGDDDLILMPQPLTLDDSWQTTPATLEAHYAGNPTLSIGGTPVPVQEYAEHVLRFTMPGEVYGDIVLSDAGRTSIARPLHRWRPQLKVSDVSGVSDRFPFLTMTATVTLQGRATLTVDSLWLTPPPNETADPPMAKFIAGWDLDASNVGWNAGGQGTWYADDGSYSIHYQYSGSGLQTLRALDGGGGIWSLDGATARFQVCATPVFTMAWRVSDGGSGRETVDYAGFCLTTEAARTWDWTVAGGSYQPTTGVDDNLVYGSRAQVSWNPFSADPPFEEDREPR